MDNKIVNKQIPIETIIETANYLEDFKDKYSKKFELEENRNKDIPYGEKNWEYENGRASMSYTIEYKDGKNIKESDYNWFIGNLNQLGAIKSISIDLYISFYTKKQNSTINDIYNKINVSLYFREYNVSINVDTNEQENEAHNLYSEVINILENNESRYDKTMKFRKIRTQCFTISIGIVLSYIIYLLLKINVNTIPEILSEYINNKYVLVFGQWFIAILLGNVLSYWYMMSLYRPLLPDTRYAGYDSFASKSIYKDDINDYIEHSEVQIGRNWDAKKRRNKIEKIYKVTNKIILVQLLISIIMFFVL
ncbi:MAG: hypothetical protein HFJ49_01780 [Clostridia bacterium]|jgi:hypothetical protein|nr:hypothetical protein [Clostridia bacterium]